MMMPKTVLITTEISAICAVSRNAWSASGELIASQNAAAPSWNVRWKTSSSGTATRIPT